MAQLPSGSTISVATDGTFGSAKATTIVSNAAEAVVTSAAHGYNDGDIVEITSGWGRLNGRIARVKSKTTDTITLEGIDTSATDLFPPGGGLGTVRKVGTFQTLSMVTGISSRGGDAKTVTYKYLDSDVEYLINDGFSATGNDIELDADAIGSAGYTALKTLTAKQTNTVMLITLKSGSKIYQPCKVALNESVSLADGQINKVKCAINGNNLATRYAS